jgi:hypothetical protein
MTPISLRREPSVEEDTRNVATPLPIIAPEPAHVHLYHLDIQRPVRNHNHHCKINWEKGDDPIAKLDTAHIGDFEEHKRIRYSIGSNHPKDVAEAEAAVGINDSPTQNNEITLADSDDQEHNSWGSPDYTFST